MTLISYPASNIFLLVKPALVTSQSISCKQKYLAYYKQVFMVAEDFLLNVLLNSVEPLFRVYRALYKYSRHTRESTISRTIKLHFKLCLKCQFQNKKPRPKMYFLKWKIFFCLFGKPHQSYEVNFPCIIPKWKSILTVNLECSSLRWALFTSRGPKNNQNSIKQY